MEGNESSEVVCGVHTARSTSVLGVDVVSVDVGSVVGVGLSPPVLAFVVFAAFPLAQVFGNLLRLAVMDVPPLVVVVLGAGLYKR